MHLSTEKVGNMGGEWRDFVYKLRSFVKLSSFSLKVDVC